MPKVAEVFEQGPYCHITIVGGGLGLAVCTQKGTHREPIARNLKDQSRVIGGDRWREATSAILRIRMYKIRNHIKPRECCCFFFVLQRSRVNIRVQSTE